jgi:hypothetical protein
LYKCGRREESNTHHVMFGSQVHRYTEPFSFHFTCVSVTINLVG